MHRLRRWHISVIDLLPEGLHHGRREAVEEVEGGLAFDFGGAGAEGSPLIAYLAFVVRHQDSDHAS